MFFCSLNTYSYNFPLSFIFTLARLFNLCNREFLEIFKTSSFPLGKLHSSFYDNFFIFLFQFYYKILFKILFFVIPLFAYVFLRDFGDGLIFPFFSKSKKYETRTFSNLIFFYLYLLFL